MASFRIVISGNSDEGIRHWDIQSQSDSRHNNDTDLEVMRSVYDFIGTAVHHIDDFLLNLNNTKGDSSN